MRNAPDPEVRAPAAPCPVPSGAASAASSQTQHAQHWPLTAPLSFCSSGPGGGNSILYLRTPEPFQPSSNSIPCTKFLVYNTQCGFCYLSGACLITTPLCISSSSFSLEFIRLLVSSRWISDRKLRRSLTVFECITFFPKLIFI